MEEEKQPNNNEPVYSKLANYYNGEIFLFSLREQPTIPEFEKIINEPIYKAANCVLNTVDNFPLKYKKNGELARKQREYYNKDDKTYMGKKIDYIESDASKWNNSDHEWLYCLVYDGHIVKIGMTITSLQERYCGSYSCGTSRAMEKGSCSTTNYIISECNFYALAAGMTVEIYAICCPKTETTVTRFGITKTIYLSSVREYETMLTQCFHNTYGHKPVLCVQEGK